MVLDLGHSLKNRKEGRERGEIDLNYIPPKMLVIQERRGKKKVFRMVLLVSHRKTDEGFKLFVGFKNCDYVSFAHLYKSIGSFQLWRKVNIFIARLMSRIVDLNNYDKQISQGLKGGGVMV